MTGNALGVFNELNEPRELAREERGTMKARISVGIALALAASAAFAVASLAASPVGDQPTPIARGGHISGVAQASSHRPPAAGGVAATTSTCLAPGSGNYKTNCHGTGRPVNETWIATNGSQFVAGANDYNSYNGQGQNGYYWSSDAVTWNDAGPIDVFPHQTNNAAGDPGLAIDGNGVVYYSSIFFNFYSCSVGGVELLRRDPGTGAWSYYQIAANSSAQFQDKPALALDEANKHVYVSWTQFGSCSGAGVTSPIKVAVFPTGVGSVAPTAILPPVPGSTYSQGSSIASDGAGGFWIAWEEWASSSSANGSIKLAHWDGTGWVASDTKTISPVTGFTDLPSPLSGFAFRDNSFPALTVSGGKPYVVWTSADGGAGRAYLWSNGSLSTVYNSGGDQFFPSIAPDGSGGVYVAFSMTNAQSYDQFLAHGGTVTKVSTASSLPSQDAFFSGQFVGDYNGLAVSGGTAHPIWTDIRGPDPSYPGYEMDAMVSSPASTTRDFVLSASPASRTVKQGGSTTFAVTIAPVGGFSGSVALSATLPASVTGSFSPNPATSSSTLSLTVASNAAPGNYTLTIAGTSGSLAHTTAVTLTVQKRKRS